MPLDVRSHGTDSGGVHAQATSTTHILSLLRSDHLNLIFPRMSSRILTAISPAARCSSRAAMTSATMLWSLYPRHLKIKGRQAYSQSRFTSFRQSYYATLFPAAIVIPINCSISHGNTSARPPMGMNGCRPSVTGFTTTSNIATAQGGRISPHQRQLNNATGCAVISPMWWWLFAGRSTCLPAMCRVTFQTLALSSPVTQKNPNAWGSKRGHRRPFKAAGLLCRSFRASCRTGNAETTARQSTKDRPLDERLVPG